MSSIVIKGDKLYVNDQEGVSLDDLFSTQFFQISNLKSSNYQSSSLFVNEMFLNVIQPYLALKFFFENNKVESCNITEASSKLKLYIFDLSKTLNFSITGSGVLKSQFIKNSRAYLNIVLTTVYLLWLMIRIPFNRSKLVKRSKFSVVRSPASLAKISALRLSHIEEEDPKRTNTLYRIATRRKRMVWVVTSMFESFNALLSEKRFIRSKIGSKSSALVSDFYGTRLVHTFLYDKLIGYYFSKQDPGQFYTGNNLDRFSVIEEKQAHAFGHQVICIPHGLEYGFKFPKGFSGDVFYTTSLKAAKYFNTLYQESKFVFEKDIATKIFRLKKEKLNHEVRVVFFTEPREPWVNLEILDNLIPILKEKGINLSLKLHPKDSEERYAKYELNHLNNMEDALIRNVCFSRKSTTLLEAIYNDSKAAAIIINAKDDAIFGSFPSLQTEEIKKMVTIPELSNWIERELLEKVSEIKY